MKRILITGENSYVGNNFENWLGKSSKEYFVDSLDLKGDSWKNSDFSSYDIIFHVAGIAHVSSNSKKKDLYYSVNRDLCIETAKKAKAEGVDQFIFMSSLKVYGEAAQIGCEKVIDEKTKPKPDDIYGKSKLLAEEGLNKLDKENFKVVIIRSPMIYGSEAKGNYSRLSKFAKISPIFPDIDNQRSMIHIHNFCEFVKLMVDNKERGIFFPQNKEYVKTSKMVKMISVVNEKNIKLVSIFNNIIKLMSKKFSILNKIFGNIVYEKSISEYKEEYRILDFKESIEEAEK
ncbi:NAD-dependent epimerase/dehydratase family protein [Halarsenatibacter silvermanii]|uniref:UDP-glucose 4-epimerase n=1 Tax=Halarsenatibacter silvermanii TaxID=321763 RepID=A0A1G9S9T4_9FIRM|nr:NAD-dependent epimerase/dehydratase family protein [Halarsenatibacter silvermanii]SDM32216.1 UDP-glucose 4-epimerase [Halarsenatibacter silvermanii]